MTDEDRKPGRPQGPPKTHKKISFDAEIWDQVAEIAAYEGRTQSAQVNIICREYLEAQRASAQ